MFKSFTIKAVYSIFKNTIKHGFYFVDEQFLFDHYLITHDFNIDMVNKYRHVSIDQCYGSREKKIEQIEYVYRILYSCQHRVVFFSCPQLYSIAIKIIISHGLIVMAVKLPPLRNYNFTFY